MSRLGDAMPVNGPSLREYVEALFAAHKAAHGDHEAAHTREHGFAQQAIDTAATLAKDNKADANEWRSAMNDRERSFATKVELKAIADLVQKLDDSDIKRSETERLKTDSEVERRREDDQRQSRQQWVVGIVAGLGAVLVNLALRLWGQ